MTVNLITDFSEIEKWQNMASYASADVCIIKARGRQLQHHPHRGYVSVKCAFGGKHHYRMSSWSCAVSDQHFLVLNGPTIRSSSFKSPHGIEILQVCFNESFFHSIASSSGPKLSGDPSLETARLTERLYSHSSDNPLSILLKRLNKELPNISLNAVEDMCCVIACQVVQTQQRAEMEIDAMRFAKAVTRRDVYERLHHSRDFITSHFRERITLDSMAQVACLNSYSYIREFKRLFGITPHKYLQQLRLQEAKQIITMSSCSVGEACRAVGFHDLSSFSKLFKKTFGVNPQLHHA